MAVIKWQGEAALLGQILNDHVSDDLRLDYGGALAQDELSDLVDNREIKRSGFLMDFGEIGFELLWIFFEFSPYI